VTLHHQQGRAGVAAPLAACQYLVAGRQLCLEPATLAARGEVRTSAQLFVGADEQLELAPLLVEFLQMDVNAQVSEDGKFVAERRAGLQEKRAVARTRSLASATHTSSRSPWLSSVGPQRTR